MSKSLQRIGRATLTIAAVLFIGASLSAESKDASKAKKGGDAYVVDASASELKWVGRKVTGQHNGTVNVKSGEIHAAKDKITAGSLVIDMASIKVLDLTDPDSNGKLTGHLKSNDFFGVEQNPTATFKIKEVTPVTNAKDGAANSTVKGDLTIKGQTHPLEFPATVTIQNNELKAWATGVKVDRTLYDIRYGSGKFFQNLGDKVIYDDFTIDLTVVAKKK